MSHSEEEDDFLSADEDVDGNEDECDNKLAASKDSSARHEIATASNQKESIKSEVITKTVLPEEDGLIPDHKQKSFCGELDGVPQTADVFVSKQHVEQENRLDRGKETEEEAVASSSDIDKSDNLSKADSSEDNFNKEDEIEEEDQDDDDEEEAALAERIRERNLKIARNFSVEIAKNLKVSAPIPVRVSTGPNRRDGGLQTGADLSGSMNPPAPPPTPALSSSFSNLNDQIAQSTSSGSSPSLTTTQYSWRLPPKTVATDSSPEATRTITTCPTTEAEATAAVATPTPAIASNLTNKNNNDSSGQSTNSAASVDASEQARQALDRLSARLSQPEKNLFEKVAADIRNMSITGDDSITAADVTSQLNALPATISDLGTTLGGWGWSGATKLFSSATQVTSQVGSVLNSIVDVAQQQPSESAQAPASVVERRDDVLVSESVRRVAKSGKDD